MIDEEAELLRHVQSLGEAEVRKTLAVGGFSLAHHEPAVQWIAGLDRERFARAAAAEAATEAERLAIDRSSLAVSIRATVAAEAAASEARRASDAAERQAAAAEAALRIARRANIISVIAMITAAVATAFPNAIPSIFHSGIGQSLWRWATTR